MSGINANMPAGGRSITPDHRPRGRAASSRSRRAQVAPNGEPNDLLVPCRPLHRIRGLSPRECYFELGTEPQFWASGSSALSKPRPEAWFRNLPERTPWSAPRKKGPKPVKQPPVADV